MKKIITLLFVSLVALLPCNLFAEEGVNEVNGDEASVVLYANIASQYTVKLPARVDVRNETTTFNVFAKGSIAADKKLDITCPDGTHTLTDQTIGSSRSYPLTVNVADGSFAADALQLDYRDDLKSVFTVSHAALMAGDYIYNMPVLISLNNIS